jgi:hypothetical protein
MKSSQCCSSKLMSSGWHNADSRRLYPIAARNLDASSSRTLWCWSSVGVRNHQIVSSEAWNDVHMNVLESLVRRLVVDKNRSASLHTRSWSAMLDSACQSDPPPDSPRSLQ